MVFTSCANAYKHACLVAVEQLVIMVQPLLLIRVLSCETPRYMEGGDATSAKAGIVPQTICNIDVHFGN